MICTQRTRNVMGVPYALTCSSWQLGIVQQYKYITAVSVPGRQLSVIRHLQQKKPTNTNSSIGYNSAVEVRRTTIDAYRRVYVSYQVRMVPDCSLGLSWPTLACCPVDTLLLLLSAINAALLLGGNHNI